LAPSTIATSIFPEKNNAEKPLEKLPEELRKDAENAWKYYCWQKFMFPIL